jgi:LmbE family N-acetylglucosaminyl deacetylase
MNVVVFSPHPDDELIGCGGTLIDHVKKGDNVIVVYITSGENGNPRYSPEMLKEIWEKEGKKG